ncbi:hypothetical protein [Mycoplasma todarodis]|uniref:Uncharacterized protein n=1 Tax=Mycoplasma todarodis TaxID=1937191 RepID=A0A4R0XMK9_9MOLU|nr:hypothetical protein [Mycoplasma todarodis]TCG11950.1 hypothetical protein C4B25_00400 [Mycoplasma todarodis]
MIKKFNLQKEYKKVLNDVLIFQEKQVRIMETKLESNRLANISVYSTTDFVEEGDFIKDMQRFKNLRKIYDVVDAKYLTLIGELISNSLIYIYSILHSKSQRSDNKNAKKLLNHYSNHTSRELFFIDVWIRNRNSWVHEGKLADIPKDEILKGLGTDKIKIDEMIKCVIKIFKKINIDYPGQKLEISIPND